MDRALELEHLALAERNIAEGEDRITNQARLITELTARGADTSVAENLLRHFRETMEEWLKHRDLIRATIAGG